jgi:hypothetical protein
VTPLAGNARHPESVRWWIARADLSMRHPGLPGARSPYERLLGEPTFFPNATEAVWTLADGRSEA